MESKNISTQWIRIREDLDKGYNELKDGRYNFAQILFEKVISMDESCASAYVGIALAEMSLTSLDSAFTYNRIGELYRKLFFTSEKICNVVLADSALKSTIFEYGYNAAEHLDAEDAKLILEFLESHNYKESTSRIYLCESICELEDKASKYLEGYREKVNAEFPAKPVPGTLQHLGLKRLIKDEEETARKYPGIINELKSIDYYYREAQIAPAEEAPPPKPKVSDWMSVKNWIIFGLWVYFFWPAAIIYLFMKRNKYKKSISRPKKSNFADKGRMEFLENKFYSVQNRYSELCEELRFKLNTMLGEEIETFESEAASLNFMVGRGKAIIEKYSKI